MHSPWVTGGMSRQHEPSFGYWRQSEQQPGWADHAAFMDRLVADGVILLGGPVGDRRRTLHVARAADETSLRERMAADPWARAGRLGVGSIEPGELWLDFRELA